MNYCVIVIVILTIIYADIGMKLRYLISMYFKSIQYIHRTANYTNFTTISAIAIYEVKKTSSIQSLTLQYQKPSNKAALKQAL